MTQNLDYDINTSKTLTSSDTDISANWTPTRSTIATGSLSSSTWTNDKTTPYSYDPGDVYYYTSGSTSDDTTYSSLSACTSAGHSEGDCAHYHAGNYYNWTAAVAMNGSSSYTANYNNVNQSICPAGWRLPVGMTAASTSGDYANLIYSAGIVSAKSTSTSSQSYATNGFVNIRAEPLWFVRSGYVYSGALNDAGSYGYYWSSSVYSSNSAYSLYFGSSRVYPQSRSDRYNGNSVRCVAR